MGWSKVNTVKITAFLIIQISFLISKIVDNRFPSIRSAFSHQDCAIIFHLTNHYAVIYALREWVIPSDPGIVSTTSASEERPSDTVVVRQLLTARRGQRPTVWMDFSEARDIMLGWKGYKMMLVKRNIGERELQESVLTVP